MYTNRVTVSLPSCLRPPPSTFLPFVSVLLRYARMMEITAAGVRTWRNGSGAVQDEPLRNWTSSVTGRTFIVEWRLFVPVLNAWVTARPIDDNQEVKSFH